ncbi:MAG: hypothetical protein P1P65_06825 [Treponema sp.]
MEKKLILEFLDTHWDDFLLLLTGTHSDNFIPDNVREFTELLLRRLAGYRGMYSDTAEPIPSDAAHLSAGAGVHDSDTKGLLGKAETFRRNQEHYGSDSPDSIINEDGLFFVQKQTENASLDPAFKKLVDSVL